MLCHCHRLGYSTAVDCHNASQGEGVASALNPADVQPAQESALRFSLSHQDSTRQKRLRRASEMALRCVNAFGGKCNRPYRGFAVMASDGMNVFSAKFANDHLGMSRQEDLRQAASGT